MNHDLIKQLELAIQVERGEVPSGEIEHRRKIPLVVSEWIHTGIPVWNFRVFEYRRKPKPVERWIVEIQNGTFTRTWFESESAALEWMEEHDERVKMAGLGSPTRRAIKLVEVTNE